MKEIIRLIVVVGIVGIIYWGVEPLAHSVMHPELPEPDFSYSDMPEYPGGDAAKGKDLVLANCTACHGLEAEGMTAPMAPTDSAAAYGVVPPDLTTAGTIYHERYLVGFLKNPVKATHTSHKFDQDYSGKGKMHPMPAYNWMSDAELNDMVAYLKSIAPSHVDDKKVFEDACSRCHDMRYTKIERTTPTAAISDYMGSNPPDLSMMIKSRGEHYLEVFINDPQAPLHGTAMPRVGLTHEAQEQVIHYMEKAGDPKKEERESLGTKIIIFMLIFTVIAYLWKVKIWREVH